MTLLGGFSALAQVRETETETETITLPPEYWDAVRDARIPEPQEIFRDLTAIAPHNPNLIWNDHGQVLVTLWTGWEGYTLGLGERLVVTRDVWVTPPFELKAFCSAYEPTEEVSLEERLRQVLGLVPGTVDTSGDRQVVELWVDPRFMFRPSPDPEITDHEAEVDFQPTGIFTGNSERHQQQYQRWFYQQYDQRYQVSGQLMSPSNIDKKNLPYPWTQLGYTYDWGNPADWDNVDGDRPVNVGLSEFVIHEWSPIAVHSTQSTDVYCQRIDETL
ncbi:MAG: hypothetical protein AAGD25_01325 [Cyanobacteria bacterium P01_F01_bin.150]